MIAYSERGVHTPGGKSAMFSTRDGTNDADVAVALNVWFDTVCDEYRMQGRELSGWAIDVGAHIGAWAIPTAMDHPELNVLAIEVVPESADLIEQNARRNGVSDRVHVIRAAAAAPGTSKVQCHWGYTADPSANEGYVAAHRFVAETWGARGKPEFSPKLPAASLDGLLAEYGIAEVSLLKIDCEGCEWQFLDSPAIGRVRVIVGEYHGGITGVEDTKGRLTELLAATHDIEILKEEPVIGLFEATRRPSETYEDPDPDDGATVPE